MTTKKSKSVFIFPSIFKIAAGAGLALALSGCVDQTPQPGPAHLQYAATHGIATTLPDLQEGRTLVLRKCAGCHSSYRFKNGTPEGWPAIMDSMALEAKLTPHQDSLIRNYLLIISGHRQDSLAALKATKSS